ncbi:MAG: hypothetical protein M3O82_10025, partial [Verrucomicrobiota bacterium]|nr:hypothetical protein [Verrucomicrobiota bacterium]
VAALTPERFAMTITPSNGIFNGTFLHPVSRKLTPFRGVFFEKQQLGAGNFAGTRPVGSSVSLEIGSVSITPR